MGGKRSLQKYKARRNFTKTPEPAGKVKISTDTKERMFVIQKHDARALHYDLRLEIGGVLVSWAIPKGPSLNPDDKRLAIMTEDHPMDYGDFEGVIPEGEYGAGPVMVWDTGTYTNIKEKDGKLVPMKTCLKNGTIEVFLHGHKIQGAYVLFKLKGRENQWILKKMRDEYASKKKNPVNTQNKSVLTERTMTQIKRDAKKE